MLNLVDGLYTYSQPGLNSLEREYYYQHVLSNDALLLELKSLAEKIAKAKDIEVGDLYKQWDSIGNDKAQAMKLFGEYFIEVQVIQQRQEETARCAPDISASMILKSRLKPSWLKANEAGLIEEYGLLWSPEEMNSVAALPRSEWLKDPIRSKVIDRIMLPSWQIRALKEFVDNEMMEGQSLKAEDLPTELSEVLGKQIKDHRSSEKTSRKNVASLKKPTGSSLATG